MPIANIIEFLVALGALIVGLGFAYGQFKQGKNESQLSTINLLKEQIEALEDKVQLQSKDIKLQSGDIEKLTGQVRDNNNKISAMATMIAEKDNQLQMMERIFQNRNPEIEQFMKAMYEAVSEFKLYVDKQDKRMAAITEVLIKPKLIQ